MKMWVAAQVIIEGHTYFLASQELKYSQACEKYETELELSRSQTICLFLMCLDKVLHLKLLEPMFDDLIQLIYRLQFPLLRNSSQTLIWICIGKDMKKITIPTQIYCTLFSVTP